VNAAIGKRIIGKRAEKDRHGEGYRLILVFDDGTERVVSGKTWEDKNVGDEL
jgi:hypothetical protein